MLKKYLKNQRGPEATDDASADAARELSAAIEERDAAIERLEQTVSEQARQIETLEQALEQAEFKTGILEKSYSTQLSEAREHAATAEQWMTDTQIRILDLEAGNTELNKKLAEAHAKLDYFGPETESIDAMLESPAKPDELTGAQRSEEFVDEPAEPQTTEEMLAPDVMLEGKSE